MTIEWAFGPEWALRRARARRRVIAWDYEDGLTPREIAGYRGLSLVAVTQVLREAGFTDVDERDVSPDGVVDSDPAP